jgi:hypothetical protein
MNNAPMDNNVECSSAAMFYGLHWRAHVRCIVKRNETDEP